MKMGTLCNRAVVVTAPEESVREAARLMREHHVGCVVVTRGPNDARVPVGIVTDRDIALAIANDDFDPAHTVSSIMTEKPYHAGEHEDVYDVLQQMRAHGLRRVPVVNARGVLQGIFTFDDMVEWMSEHMLELARLIQRELLEERASPAR